MGYFTLPSGELVPRYQPVDSNGNVLTGGGGGGGGGDASAQNQASQIALETAIRDRLPTALASNRLVVDGSGVTQPVSGSVSVGNFPATQAVSASALPLPSGAATDSVLQAVRDRLPSALASNRLVVDGSAVTQPVSGSFATQTTLESVLSKIIAAPATEAKQDALNTSISSINTTNTSILNKLIAAPATEAKQDSQVTKLQSVIDKLITAPATEAKQDVQITRETEIRDRLNAGIQVASLKLAFRDDFAGSDIDTSNWTLVQTGSGHAVSVTSSELRIDTGTTASTETIIRSTVSRVAPFRVWYMMMLNQRIANQEFYLELSDAAGNNYAQWLLDGTSATTAKAQTANAGTTTGQNTVTTASTASYQVLEIEANLEEYYFSYRTVDSSSNRNHSRTNTRQIPSPTTPLYLQIRAKNLGSAPASSTRLSLDAICAQTHQTLTTEVTGGRGSPSASQGVPVYTVGGISTTRDTSTLYTESTSTLAANATFTGNSKDGGTSPSYNKLRGWVSTDQSGTLYVEQSRDNSTWRILQTVAATAGLTAWESATYQRYIRLRYVNGAVAQGSFELVSGQWGVGAGETSALGSAAQLASQTATIASGGTLSGAIDTAAKTLLSLEMPGSWTAANISFDVSNDNSSYVACYLEGTEYTFSSGASRGHSLNPAAFAGWRYVKVRSGVTGTTVAQGASRDIKLNMKTV